MIGLNRHQLVRAWLQATLFGWVLFSIAVASQAALGLGVPDALLDYLKTTKIETNEEILYFEVDLTGEGTREIFVSNTEATDGKAGNMWTVYLQRGGEFSTVEQIPSLREDTLVLGHQGDEPIPLIASYRPISATQGQIVGYRLQGPQLTEVDLGTIEPRGKDEAMYDALFDRSNRVVIQSIKAEKLVGSIASTLTSLRPTQVLSTQLTITTQELKPSNRSSIGLGTPVKKRYQMPDSSSPTTSIGASDGTRRSLWLKFFGAIMIMFALAGLLLRRWRAKRD